MFGRLFDSIGKREEPSELPEGTRIEVLRQSGELIFVGKLEWARNGTYQIITEDERMLPFVEYNAPINLRGHLKDEVLFVEGKLVGSSVRMWRIEQNKVLRGAEQRAFFRQNVKTAVTLCCANDLRGDECGEKTPKGQRFTGLMLNLSAGGAQIKTTADFAMTDWINLMEVELVPDMDPFSFVCAIRRKTDVDDKGVEFIYGCEFLDLGSVEQDRLIKAILTLQRKELRARRGAPGV